jgi:hypothetical protein
VKKHNEVEMGGVNQPPVEAPVYEPVQVPAENEDGDTEMGEVEQPPVDAPAPAPAQSPAPALAHALAQALASALAQELAPALAQVLVQASAESQAATVQSIEGDPTPSAPSVLQTRA